MVKLPHGAARDKPTDANIDLSCRAGLLSASMGNPLVKNWTMVACRGGLAILFGLAILLWRGLTLNELVTLFGAYAALDGLYTLASVLRRSSGRPLEWWHRASPRLRAAVCGAVALLATVAIVCTLASRDARVPLFPSALQNDQLAEVDRATSLFRQSQLAERQGSPGEALKLRAEATSRHPSVIAFLFLANFEYQQGHMEEARDHYKEALRLEPGNLSGIKGLNQIEVLVNPEQAVKRLSEAVKRDPGPDSLINLGVSLLSLRRYVEAEADLGRKYLARLPASHPHLPADAKAFEGPRDYGGGR